MPRLGEFALRYGTSVALLAICLVVSLLTLSDQYPVGQSAARQVIGELNGIVEAGDHVLIVARNSQEDREFSKAMHVALEPAGVPVTVVNGTPQDARRSLVELDSRQVELAAIAGTMPHPLDTDDPEQQAANRAYAEAWSGRLMGCQRVALL